MTETESQIERHGFGAEVGRLLDLVVHSLYSEREIFLRELVANAADATDRRRFESLTHPALALPEGASIRILPHKPDRTLTIADSGIGMTREELVDHLGTIARSGTRAFGQKLEETKPEDRPTLIGQFGVGFYSAFMVADRVEVTSRKAGTEEAWTWASDGRGEFTMAPAQRDAPGTEIVLHVKSDAEEYLDPIRIEAVVRKWADHITVPITIERDGKDVPANEGTALWRKPKAEIGEQAYNEFYRHLGHLFDTPWATLHWHAEGAMEFSALLFVPGSRPFEPLDNDRTSKVRLHVRRMFITDAAELLPAWLRFVQGVVDTEDLPLNVSREMLQSTPVLARIRRAMTNRVLTELKSKAREPDDYKSFWENFGAVLKEGIWEDNDHRKDLAPLLRFRSSAAEGWNGLPDYVGRMKEGQEAIYVLAGDNAETLGRSAQLEGFRARGIEVLLLTDPIDAFWPDRMDEFDGKPIRSVTQGAADLSKLPPPEGAAGEAADVTALLAALKAALSEAVGEVRATDRLVDSAVVMVENIFRQVSRRQGGPLNIREIVVDAAAEMDRPLFYAVAVIVAGFLPIYVLSGPSGKLFKPMADTMVFALVGSLIVTLTLLPVLCAWFMRKGVRERRNVVFEASKSAYTKGLDVCLAHPWGTTLVSALLLAASLLLVPRIGAEFMPQLDEGALWVRATMPYTISFDEAAKIAPRIRRILRSFPQVTTVASELGRPDDGTDATGFFNVEFFVGLKPYSQWTGPCRNKPELIDAINRKLQALPGIIFNYTQPAEDAVDEAETGLKSALAVKVFGPDLKTLEQKGTAIKQILKQVRGIRDVTVVQELGQPSLTINIDRARIARYGLNVSDINSMVEAAVGGDVATQVVQGEKQFPLVVRLARGYRDSAEAISNVLVTTSGGQQIPLKEFADIQVTNGASFIYREDNSRYIGVQFSVEGRDLAGAVEDAIYQVKRKVPLPEGYRLDWGGEYKEYTASRRQLSVIVPLTLFLIFLLLFALYSNFSFPFITVLGVLLSSPVGGIVALWLTGTPFSVSSGIGFLALFGVSVQTAVVYISYVNELRQGGVGLAEAVREAAIVRLRPLMMTALVAALGLLPAALATGVGADTQRPFALVIVGGLFSRLLISIFLMPALYALVARSGDRLEA